MGVTCQSNAPSRYSTDGDTVPDLSHCHRNDWRIIFNYNVRTDHFIIITLDNNSPSGNLIKRYKFLII